MEILGQNEIWSFLDGKPAATKIKRVTEVTGSAGHLVGSYLELARKVAEIQFKNPEHVFLFRGQSADYRNQKNNTTLKPSIFRSTVPNGPPPSTQVLGARFVKLRQAERKLVETYPKINTREKTRITRQRILQWSILQHYVVCETPLLDVTHSLRIAASFASHRADEKAFLFVIAVPNISGAITASAEAGLQIIRLASVCPPTAMRPHLQEGYLLGEYPDLADFNQKSFYQHYEVDFGRRLIGKFRFNPNTFWREDAFRKVPLEDLYSESNDPFMEIIRTVKQSMALPES